MNLPKVDEELLAPKLKELHLLENAEVSKSIYCVRSIQIDRCLHGQYSGEKKKIINEKEREE